MYEKRKEKKKRMDGKSIPNTWKSKTGRDKSIVDCLINF